MLARPWPHENRTHGCNSWSSSMPCGCSAGGKNQTHTPCAPQPRLSLCSYRQGQVQRSQRSAGQLRATLAVRGSTGLALLRSLASNPPPPPPCRETPLPLPPTGGVHDVSALWACTWWWLWRARSGTAMSIPGAACLENLQVCRCPSYLSATTAPAQPRALQCSHGWPLEARRPLADPFPPPPVGGAIQVVCPRAPPIYRGCSVASGTSPAGPMGREALSAP